MSDTVHILGVPLDHGAGRRGVSMGPSALRIAHIHEALERVGYEVHDHGDIDVTIPESLSAGDPGARYLSLVSEVCGRVADETRRIFDEGGLPLVLGGDHSIAIGTISGLSASLSARDPARRPGDGLGVLWFDAHADINTPETSPSGNIHGMAVACLLGSGPGELVDLAHPGPKLSPERIVQVGLRDVDTVEKRLLRESGVRAYTMADIDARGIAAVVEEALARVSEGTELLHVSFDIDVLDPLVAPGTGTTKIGGLTYREAHLALEMVAASGRLSSFELVEVNPILDDRNRTAELGVGLITSALGESIL